MEKISVVIPAYNAENTIERAVESVLDQTWRNVEIIIVDDGSTDGTAEIADRLSRANPSVRVIHRENGGVSRARNDGILAARGRWLMTLDDDDYIDPEMLEWLELRTRDGACDLVMCGMKLVYEDHEEVFRPEKEYFDDREGFIRRMMLWLYDNHLLTTHSNKLYDMDILRREKILYDPSLQINEDIDFVLRYMRHCGTIGVIRGAYLNYVQHGVGESLITTFQQYGISSSLKLLQDLEELLSDIDPGKRTVNGLHNRILVHILSFAGIMYYRSSLTDEEKLDQIRRLAADPEFRKLLRKTRPESLKTAAAQLLLLAGCPGLYHRICRLLYRGYERKREPEEPRMPEKLPEAERGRKKERITG